MEQAGSGKSARKEEKQNTDQPIRRQQWRSHDGMHQDHRPLLIFASDTILQDSCLIIFLSLTLEFFNHNFNIFLFSPDFDYKLRM